MRMSKEAAAASRVRIVAEASRLLRERGIGATSIADVMAAAGMTHGGFYKHFRSKDDLVEAAIASAFATHADRFAQRSAAYGPQAALHAYVDEYLSEGHVTHPGFGCPATALGSDAGREAEGVTSAFAQGVEALIEHVATAAPVAMGTPEARAAAIRRLTMMVGAVVVARGVGNGQLRSELLTACLDEARSTVD